MYWNSSGEYQVIIRSVSGDYQEVCFTGSGLSGSLRCAALASSRPCSAGLPLLASGCSVPHHRSPRDRRAARQISLVCIASAARLPVARYSVPSIRQSCIRLPYRSNLQFPQQSVIETISRGCFPEQSRENFRTDGLRAVPPLGGPTSGRLRRLWESVYPKTRLAPLGGSPAEIIALAVEVFPSGKPLFLMRWLSVLRRKAFIPRSASSSRVRVGFCLRPGQDRSRKLTLRRRGSRRCLSRDPPGLRSLPTLLPAFRVSARGTGEPFCRCDGLGLPRESPGAGALFPCSPWSDSARVSLRSPRSESPAVGHRFITVLRSVRLLSGCCSSGVSAGAPPP